MVIYYEEHDLASFGNYMISEARKKSITENSELSDDKKEEVLGRVTTFDIGNWHRLRVEAEKEVERREMEKNLKTNAEKE